jgi:hypothetical protein
MKLPKLALGLVFSVLATAVSAHHSPFLFFDPSQTIEIEGEVTRVTWKNPHASFEVRSNEADGSTRTWEVEANSVSILRRMNLTKDSVKIGDEVRIAGWPGKRGGADIFVINMLIPGGTEIVFMPGQKIRWASESTGDEGDWMLTEADIADPQESSNGIFYTWSTSLATIREILMFDGYPFVLTEAAMAARAGYDLYDNPIFKGDCVHKGMPTIMEQPYPMELVDNGDTITVRMEEGDAVREIRMGESADVSDRSPDLMGYSFGKWEGDSLVVTTARSSWPYVDMTGVPNSADAVYVERFTPQEDGKRLNYTMTVTDPGIFVEPVVVSKYWLRIEDAEVRPYECQSA